MPRKFRLATESRQGYKRLLGWRRAWICFGALALLSLASLIWLAYRTSQVLNQLVAQLQAASKVAFGLQLLDPFSRGSRGALRVEPISSADVFSDVVEADGRLYLAAPPGCRFTAPTDQRSQTITRNRTTAGSDRGSCRIVFLRLAAVRQRRHKTQRTTRSRHRERQHSRMFTFVQRIYETQQ